MTEAKAKDESRAGGPAQKPAASGGPAAKGAEPASADAAAKAASQQQTAAKVAKALANKVIRFNCNKCNKELRVPIANAGKEGKCPHCGETTLAPAVKIIATKKAAAKKDAAAAPAKDADKAKARAMPASRLLPPGMKIPEKKVSLRDTFGVVKVKCPGCGLTQVFQKNRTTRFEECHGCGKVITFPTSDA